MLTPSLDKTHYSASSLSKTDFNFCVLTYDIQNAPTYEAIEVLEYFGLRMLNLYKI